MTQQYYMIHSFSQMQMTAVEWLKLKLVCLRFSKPEQNQTKHSFKAKLVKISVKSKGNVWPENWCNQWNLQPTETLDYVYLTSLGKSLWPTFNSTKTETLASTTEVEHPLGAGWAWDSRSRSPLRDRARRQVRWRSAALITSASSVWM